MKARASCLGAILLTLVTLAAAGACAPTVARPQTVVMEKTGKVSVSAAVLRARVNDLVDRSAGRVEQTADRMRSETDDHVIRWHALALKVDAIPAIYTAGFRADPLIAAMDVWGFAFQFDQFVKNGAGQQAFGSQQPLVIACARDLLADADAVVKAIAIKPEYFDLARERVQAWARINPVENTFSARASAASLLADLQTGDRNVFVTVGTISDVVENLSERLNTYAAQIPKQARWQAEILVGGITGEQGLEGAIGDVHDLGLAARRASDLFDDVPGLIETQRELIATEREAVLSGVNTQRQETLNYLRSERFAMVNAVHEERLAVIEAIREERLRGVSELDSIRIRAIDSAMARLDALVDRTFWRVVVLWALTLASGALALIAYWLIARRHARVTVTRG